MARPFLTKDAIRELRSVMGRVSQFDLAVMLGRKQVTVGKWERGENPLVDVAILQKLAALANEHDRPDLAAVFRRAATKAIGSGGAVAQVAEWERRSQLPEAEVLLREVDTLLLGSEDFMREIRATRAYLRWRQVAHPDDVQRVEREIKGDLMEG